MCAGNEDPKFLELAIVRNGNFNDMSGKYRLIYSRLISSTFT